MSFDANCEQLNAVNAIKTIELPPVKLKRRRKAKEVAEKSKHLRKEMHRLDKVQDIFVGQYSE